MDTTRFPSLPRALALCAALMLAAAVTACSEDDPVSGTREFGTYALVRVNDQALPFSITTVEGNVVVQSALLTLTQASSGNPSYVATVSGTRAGTQGVILSDAGRYTVSGSTLTFSSTTVPGLVYPASRSGNTVTVTVPGIAVGAAGTISLRFERNQ